MKFIYLHFLLVIIVSINASRKIESRSGNLVEEYQTHRRTKRAAVLLAIGVTALAIDVYQKTVKCKNEAPTLYPNFKKYEKLIVEFTSERGLANTDWNPVVEVSGYTERINSYTKSLSTQLEGFFESQFDFLSMMDPDINSKLAIATEELEALIAEKGVLTMKEIELPYTKAYGFSMKQLTSTAELTGVLLHMASHYFHQSISIAYIKHVNVLNGGVNFGAGANLAKVDRLAGATRAIQTKMRLDVGLKSMTTLTNVATGVLTLAAAANVIYQIISYEEKCKKLEEKAQEAVDKMEEAVAKVKVLRTEIEEIRVNTTAAYDVYETQLTDITVIEAMNLLVNYTTDSTMVATRKAQVLATLNTFISGYVALSIKQRDHLLQELTGYAMPSILRHAKCNNEKLKIVLSMTNECKVGRSTLDALYDVQAVKYSNLAFNCEEEQPLVKAQVISAVTANLALANKSSTCAHHDEDMQKLVCGYYKVGKDAAAIEQEQAVTTTLSAVEYLITLCSTSESVPLPIGKEEICAAKSDGTLVEVQQKFTTWISTEVESIYNACKPNQVTSNNICTDKNNGYPIATINKNNDQYSAAIILEVYDACPKLTEIIPNDRNMICTLKAAGFTIETSPISFSHYEESAVKAAYEACPSVV